jgi:signal transduction histidine kinase
MRERVQALEGSFQLRQLEPAGVGIVVNFPLMKNAEP